MNGPLSRSANMLAILWLMYWASVGEAFYDDYNRYTSDDGANNKFQSQRLVHENFTIALRSFAQKYTRIARALRLLKIFEHSGGYEDFEPNNGQALAFIEREYHHNLRKPKKLCEEGTTWYDGCNWCQCGTNGEASCTTDGCIKPSLHHLRHSKANRTGVCTKKTCIVGVDKSKKEDKKKKKEKKQKNVANLPPNCKRGQKMIVDCTLCMCVSPGLVWECDKRKILNCGNAVKIRPIKSQLPPNCKRGQIIIDNCNLCMCISPGQNWICDKSKIENCRYAVEKGPIKLPTVLRLPNHEDSYEVKPCTIGERHRVDACNYCYCNEYGKRVCSENECEMPEKVEPYYDDKDSATNGRSCVLGTRFRKGVCNYCYCNYKRKLVCSNNKCGKSKSRYLRVRYPCHSEEIYKLDNCNYCFCNAEHERVCTDFNCNPKTKRNVTQTRATMKPQSYYLSTGERSCTEGSHRQIDECNYCVCVGIDEYCTQKDCSRYSIAPVGFTESQCKVGEPLRPPDLCNVCICFNSEILCTNKSCNDIQSAPTGSSESECEVGEPLSAPDPCNVCICLNSKILCTNNPCIESPSDVKPCPEGRRRQVDACNYCVCRSGIEFCTLKPCEKDTITPIIFSEPECVVGEPVPAPDPCNMCICVNWDILCTNNLCNTRRLSFISVANYILNIKPREYKERVWVPPPVHCTDIGRFRIDNCNYCYCNQGKRVCDNHVCDPKKIDTRYPKNRPSRGCDVGSRYIKGKCEVCVCHVDHILRCFIKESLCKTTYVVNLVPSNQTATSIVNGTKKHN